MSAMMSDSELRVERRSGASSTTPVDTDRISDLQDSVKRIEDMLEKQTLSPKKPGHGHEGVVDVVLGAQWGDEGKGKLVDILSQNYNICARVAGGSNAGHTIVVGDKTFKFHLLPSGMLHPGTMGVIGNGVVVHIPTLLKEMKSLEEAGIDFEGRLKISDRAHIVFDFHQQVDGVQEGNLGRNKIGTTKKGIGPAYSSKIVRNGVRIGDLRFFDDFKERFRALVEHAERAHGNSLHVDVEKEIGYYESVRELIVNMTADTIALTNTAFDSGKRILVEGANATMLDIDFGTYPYVTSSNPSVGSVCTGLGVPPNKISNIFGTVKSYCTRVGEGPFPTETLGETGDTLRKNGGEFGTTTGRPRRCGWLDIPQMRYSTLVNGYSVLNLTKLDVLTGMEEVQIGVAYKFEGKCLDSMPSSLNVLKNVQVEYEVLAGWEEDISDCKEWDDLPTNAQVYVRRVEELLGVYIRWIGVGQDRLAVIDRYDRYTGSP
ncbi:unnamed protein product [Ectocarpus sp. 6 AP-2014]